MAGYDLVTVYHVEDADETPITMPKWIAERYDEFREYNSEDDAIKHQLRHATVLIEKLLGKEK
jgi:hypothetical protein